MSQRLADPASVPTVPALESWGGGYSPRSPAGCDSNSDTSVAVCDKHIFSKFFLLGGQFVCFFIFQDPAVFVIGNMDPAAKPDL